MSPRIGFLAAAPRISTHPDAEMSGPRSRVLGIIKGFETLNWEVEKFIVGDRVPQNWSAKGSSEVISKGFFRTLAVDLVRLGLSIINSWKSWRELGSKVDFVYEYAATLQCLGWIFQRQGIPWILQVEALLFYEAKAERKALVLDGIAKWIEIQSYRKCDVLACVSETLKEILVHDYGIETEKIVLVNNGVDTDFINPELYTPYRTFPGFTIGFIGSLYAWSGLNLLLEVIAELRDAGIDISLAVVGDGVMKSTWEKQAQDLGISENVAFVGRVSREEVPKYISGFDIGYSGQIQLQMGQMYLSPMKLYEYMSMAKPVIASAFEDAKRLIEDGQTGFLFQPEDKADLQRKLLLAFQQQEKLSQMGHLARAEIINHHSWTSRIEVLVESMEKILEKPSRVTKLKSR
ncbi:glycosyltransferase family 4 protein [Mastigocoleus testarum]|uniref:Group 1 glycosyl transferase n=1 Tax=Mastigocoleus testarum BC008 TaxID=371196 RepID=A0A0V7ZKG8_9CYAN|nr:glycosyltransferase family 4 protein [Mastigocoleus testarum]KST65140.1 group 1 glycosyl transferase [Mastigocoleus testarum BC008]